MNKFSSKSPDSSWENSSNWYNKIVGKEGHYYHKQVILPNLKDLIVRSEDEFSLLDLGCGQGLLARFFKNELTEYVGVDISSSLIQMAKRFALGKHFLFVIKDLTQPLSLKKTDFTHAAIILALQNISNPLTLLKNAACHLRKNGQLIVTINHPCFRIPKKSSWQIDEEKKIQYRRIDSYMTPLEIPIAIHPSQNEASSQSLSFHYPLSSLTQWFQEAGFVIQSIKEWCSDKKSEGRMARMENKSRREFPLFLTFVGRKI